MILSHAPPCSCKSKEKEKEKKRNINNDLAVLPSHDNKQVKKADNSPIYPSKNSFSFSKKKECNNILKE